jgi:hypothetical protein
MNFIDLLARVLLEGNESLYLIAYDFQTKLKYHQIKLKIQILD